MVKRQKCLRFQPSDLSLTIAEEVALESSPSASQPSLYAAGESTGREETQGRTRNKIDNLFTIINGNLIIIIFNSVMAFQFLRSRLTDYLIRKMGQSQNSHTGLLDFLFLTSQPPQSFNKSRNWKKPTCNFEKSDDPFLGFLLRIHQKRSTTSVITKKLR